MKIFHFFARLRLRFKFSLVMIGLVTAIITVILYLVYLRQKDSILQQARGRAADLAIVLSVAAVRASVVDDYLVLQELVDSIHGRDEVLRVMVLNSDGRVLVHNYTAERGKIYPHQPYRDPIAKKAPVIVTTTLGEENVVEATAPIIVNDEPVAYARVIISLQFANQEIRKTANAIILIGLGSAAFAAFLGTFLACLVTAPLKRLYQDARQIGRGERDIRVDVVSSDEFGMLQRALKTMIDEVRFRSSLAALGTTMAQLSHEFRTPLATITKYFNDAAAKENALTPPTQNGRCDKLLGEVNRLNDLANQLLQFSQKHKLISSRTDVNLLIEQALFLHDAAIREHHIQVNYAPAKLPAIVADKSLLQSVFVNLIGNAIEAMEREGRLQIQTHLVNGQKSALLESAAMNNGKSSTNGALATKTPAGVAKRSLSRLTRWLFVNPKESCNGAAERTPLTAESLSWSVNGWPQKTGIQTFSPEKNVVAITIADNGAGIPEDKMDQLFLPFFTTKRNGTGLGLALSHKIILEHYGSIQVQSKVGEGTIFTIILPL